MKTTENHKKKTKSRKNNKTKIRTQIRKHEVRNTRKQPGKQKLLASRFEQPINTARERSYVPAGRLSMRGGTRHQNESALDNTRRGGRRK